MRLKDYRKFITGVQQYCGVTRATLSFWRTGKVQPNTSSKRINTVIFGADIKRKFVQNTFIRLVQLIFYPQFYLFQIIIQSDKRISIRFRND